MFIKISDTQSINSNFITSLYASKREKKYKKFYNDCDYIVCIQTNMIDEIFMEENNYSNVEDKFGWHGEKVGENIGTNHNGNHKYFYKTYEICFDNERDAENKYNEILKKIG